MGEGGVEKKTLLIQHKKISATGNFHILQRRELVAIAVLVSPFDDPVAVLTRVGVNVEFDLAHPSWSSNLRDGSVWVRHK